MMLDVDIVAVSPSSVWRVLSQAGLLSKWNGKASKKGTGFVQPLAPHQHWHIDVSYLNIGGTFYYLCSILDGFSRYIVNWDIRETVTGSHTGAVVIWNPSTGEAHMRRPLTSSAIETAGIAQRSDCESNPWECRKF
jgi:transposase InsO family protein